MYLNDFHNWIKIVMTEIILTMCLSSLKNIYVKLFLWRIERTSFIGLILFLTSLAQPGPQFYIQLVFKAPLCITLPISYQKIFSGSLKKFKNEKKHPKKLHTQAEIPSFQKFSFYCPTAQMAEFMFPNVTYRATVYRTG